MSWYQSNWECTSCGHIWSEMVQVPHGHPRPELVTLECPKCKDNCPHEKRISAPAAYLGEKVWRPEVHGGKFDTMGRETLPKLPELPRTGKERWETLSGERLERPINEIDHHASMDVVASKEYREVKAEREEVKRRNRAKKQRATAMRKDPNLSIRHNKLAGDPKY